MKAYYCISKLEYSGLGSICVAYCETNYQARKCAIGIAREYCDDYSLSDFKIYRVKKLDYLHKLIQGDYIDLWDGIGNIEILEEKGHITYMTKREREKMAFERGLNYEKGSYFINF